MLMPVRSDTAGAVRIDAAAWTRRVPADVWALVAFVALGAALRFATIATQSYWVDEATTAHEMQLSFGAMLHQLSATESTPPLYYVLAWLWSKPLGTGEAGLRSLSALAGTAAIPIAYLCARELVSRRAGVIAAAMTAVSPFMIWYSQEARAYMLFAALSGLSFLFFARAWTRRSNRDVLWWAVFSALAILTHFFAGFLVAPEALLLLLGGRTRAIAVAAAAVAVVQAAVLPLAINDTSHPLLGWIKQFPLSIRIKQVPVDFGLSTLYQSPVVTDGLLGAAVLAAIVLILLRWGGEERQRRGAGIAAVIGAVVLLAPLALAEFGRDYYVVRNLIGAWIPLAVVVAAACTVPRAPAAGAALAAVLLGSFVYALVRIDREQQYQRPDWRGVAAALGNAPATRAIVSYDGPFGTQPLSLYLPGSAWSAPGPEPVSVSEVDVVGSTWQTTPSPLPAGTTLLTERRVNDFLIERFAVKPSWTMTPSAIAAKAGSLLSPAPAGSAVLIQRRQAVSR